MTVHIVHGTVLPWCDDADDAKIVWSYAPTPCNCGGAHPAIVCRLVPPAIARILPTPLHIPRRGSQRTASSSCSLVAMSRLGSTPSQTQFAAYPRINHTSTRPQSEKRRSMAHRRKTGEACMYRTDIFGSREGGTRRRGNLQPLVAMSPNFRAHLPERRITWIDGRGS